MNINAKQMLSVDYHSMDNTTALGFFGQIKDIVTQDAQVTAALTRRATRPSRPSCRH